MIEVARLNGSFRYVVISQGLDKPRAITVHPVKGYDFLPGLRPFFFFRDVTVLFTSSGFSIFINVLSVRRYLFWTEWGQYPRIERSRLDGTQRWVMVNASISWPNGISIDYEVWTTSDVMPFKMSLTLSQLTVLNIALFFLGLESVSDLFMNVINVIIFVETLFTASLNRPAGCFTLNLERKNSLQRLKKCSFIILLNNRLQFFGLTLIRFLTKFSKHLNSAFMLTVTDTLVWPQPWS